MNTTNDPRDEFARSMSRAFYGAYEQELRRSFNNIIRDTSHVGRSLFDNWMRIIDSPHDELQEFYNKCYDHAMADQLWSGSKRYDKSMETDIALKMIELRTKFVKKSATKIVKFNKHGDI